MSLTLSCAGSFFNLDMIYQKDCREYCIQKYEKLELCGWIKNKIKVIQKEVRFGVISIKEK